MKCNKYTSKSLLKVLACTVVALGAIGLAHAQAQVTDPSGTYTWAAPAGRGGGGGGGGRRGGGGGTNTLVLKLADGKLTGTLAAPAGGRGRRGGAQAADGADTNAVPAAPPAPTPIPIADAKWVAATATVSFSVSRPGRNGGDPTVIPYTGVVTADKITGTYTPPGRGGNDPMPVEWVAMKKP